MDHELLRRPRDRSSRLEAQPLEPKLESQRTEPKRGPVAYQRPLRSLTDDELLRRLGELLASSRRVEAELVAHIGEVDERRLYAKAASPSMFAYCTERLGLSEAEAYLRIAAARASRVHPQLLAMLADGRLHLSGIAKLAPHLTPANVQALLTRAAHRSKREIEELIAEMFPRPDAPPSIRKLPVRRFGHGSGAQSLASPQGLRPDRVDLAAATAPEGAACPDGGAAPRGPGATRAVAFEPLAPARYRVQFTASAGLRDKLERLQALMRGSVPDGDLATIIEEAVTEKLRRLETRRFGRTRKPNGGKLRGVGVGMTRGARPVCAEAGKTRADEAIGGASSRYIPAAVRSAVCDRDGDRCRYVDAEGHRCTAWHRLEFHHRLPFGYGGGYSMDNISLVCRAHNRYLAAVDYGKGTSRGTVGATGTRADGSTVGGSRSASDSG